MTEIVQLAEGEAEFAHPEEALWLRCKSNAEIRLRASRENVIIENAFIDLCNKKLEEFKQNSTEVK